MVSCCHSCWPLPWWRRAWMWHTSSCSLPHIARYQFPRSLEDWFVTVSSKTVLAPLGLLQRMLCLVWFKKQVCVAWEFWRLETQDAEYQKGWLLLPSAGHADSSLSLWIEHTTLPLHKNSSVPGPTFYKQTNYIALSPTVMAPFNLRISIKTIYNHLHFEVVKIRTPTYILNRAQLKLSDYIFILYNTNYVV